MITMDDYVLTNIDHETGCYTIRLKDDNEYIVYYRKEKGKKTYNFIKKDSKEIPISDEVVKTHLSAIREYQVSGIWGDKDEWKM